MSISLAASETRQHLLDVARSLMLAKGYSAVGLAEIVGQAGVPKGSFYYYFKSKEEFGQAMLQDYFDQYAGKADATLAGAGQARARLLAYFSTWAESQTAEDTSGRCLATKLGAEVCDLSNGMRDILDAGAKANIARLSRCIAEGLKDGSVSAKLPPETLADALYALWSGASLMSKLSKSRQPFDHAMAATEQMI